MQAIDLRWGVREEAALDQQTMRICLEENRCADRRVALFDGPAIELRRRKGGPW